MIVPLTKGASMIIDDEDAHLIVPYRWHLQSAGYGARSIGTRKNKRYILAHRVIANAGPDDDIDHVNWNRLDNRKCNLRIATHSQNLSNRPMQKNNTSGYRGVVWHSQNHNWMAQIKVRRKRIYIGVYGTKEDAARAYDEAALRYFGAFAQPNFSEAA